MSSANRKKLKKRRFEIGAKLKWKICRPDYETEKFPRKFPEMEIFQKEKFSQLRTLVKRHTFVHLQKIDRFQRSQF